MNSRENIFLLKSETPLPFPATLPFRADAAVRCSGPDGDIVGGTKEERWPPT